MEILLAILLALHNLKLRFLRVTCSQRPFPAFEDRT